MSISRGQIRQQIEGQLSGAKKEKEKKKKLQAKKPNRKNALSRTFTV